MRRISTSSSRSPASASAPPTDELGVPSAAVRGLERVRLTSEAAPHGVVEDSVERQAELAHPLTHELRGSLVDGDRHAHPASMACRCDVISGPRLRGVAARPPDRACWGRPTRRRAGEGSGW
jgi:hypothetical protein